MGRRRYESLFAIAEGGMGMVEVVVPADDPRGRPLARKRLLPALLADPAFREMFVDEARVASMLSHPNIVTVVDVGDHQDGPSLVMEYVQGVSAARLLAEASCRGSALPLQIAVRIALEAARGLHAAHEARDNAGQPLGIIHRDVSPHNLLVGYSGVVKVTDFGIAKAFGKSSRTSTGVLKGNLGYLAPEALRFEPTDRRSDLFALGVTLFELASGLRLYAASEEGARRILGEPPPDLIESRPEAPAELVELCLELLAKDREDRPPDAGEVARRLEEILARLIEREGTFPLAEYLDQNFAQERASDEARLAGARDGLMRQRLRRRRRLQALAAVPALMLVATGLWGARWPRGGPTFADDLLAAGRHHTCAREGVDLYCWGKNNHGQVGNGLQEVWSARQRVPLKDVISLGLGASHSCACVAGGQVHCWGRNDRGQLGNDSSAPANPRPALVLGVTGCRQVAAGESHTCALVADGTVYCWGYNLDGQIGSSPSEREPRPRPVTGLPTAVSIAAGGWNTCAVTGDRRLWCWGDQIGLGDDGHSSRATPKLVEGLEEVAEVSVGTSNVCTRGAGGAVFCWGGNSALRLDATYKDRRRPVSWPALSGARQIAVGDTFVCALRKAGEVACFGSNASRQLGFIGDRNSETEPITVPQITSAHRVVAGAAHACARHPRGISCWGSNEAGQLGDGKGIDSAFPVAVSAEAR